MDRIKDGRLEISVDKEVVKDVMRDYDLEMSRRNLALTSGAFFVGSSIIAGLAPELDLLGLPLWQLGFGLFIVTLGMLILVTIKTHTSTDDSKDKGGQAELAEVEAGRAQHRSPLVGNNT